MKVLIVGSRSITVFNFDGHVPPEMNLIISGGATGIDTLVEKYADEHRISKLIIRPEYHLYGKAAPLKRNDLMVDLADLILVIWDGASKGTMHTIKYAKKKNKNVTVIMVSNDT